VGAIFDECSFWRDETSQNPDQEIYRATLPSMMTTDGLLVGISSPYGQRGLLYQKHRESFGKDDDGPGGRGHVLVLQPDA
jgi:hypothetical protein